MRNCSGRLRIVAAIASGLLVAGLFPPFNFSWLAWFSLMPLLAVLSTVEGKRRGLKGFSLGFLAGATSCLIQFNWVSTVSSLGAVLLPLYLALYWGIFGWFAATLGRPGEKGGFGKSLREAFCIAAVWAGVESLRGWMLTGFSWNLLGVAFHDSRMMAQAADLFGVSGLSLLLVFFQSLVVLAARKWVGRQPGFGQELGFAAILVVSWFGYGKLRIAGEAGKETIPLKALLVQINIPQEAARVLWTDLEVHQAYEEETLKALDAMKLPDGQLPANWPDWVIWPECALNGRIYFTDDGSKWNWQINQDTVSQVREAGPFTLIFGVNEQEAERDGDYLVPKERGKAYNSIAVMSLPDTLETYRKRHLVIFGETIPFVDSFPLLKKIYEEQSGAEYGGSFTPGDSVEPLTIRAGEKEISAIPSVCFEDSVPRLTRMFVRPSAQTIINVTNDGWFKDSAAAAQHFAYARFRTIELRRPMLRCANTGVTAAVDSTGSTEYAGRKQVLTDEKGSTFTRGSLLVDVKVPVNPSFSLFALIGDWGIIGLAVVGFLLAVAGRESSVETSHG